MKKFAAQQGLDRYGLTPPCAVFAVLFGAILLSLMEADNALLHWGWIIVFFLSGVFLLIFGLLVLYSYVGRRKFR